MNKELLKGHIDTLLLSVLSKKEMYGYEIAKQIREKSNNDFECKEGTMYLALKRLEKNSFVESFWNDEESTGGGRRKYYRITKLGKESLAIRKQEWLFMKKTMSTFLEG